LYEELPALTDEMLASGTVSKNNSIASLRFCARLFDRGSLTGDVQFRAEGNVLAPLAFDDRRQLHRTCHRLDLREWIRVRRAPRVAGNGRDAARGGGKALDSLMKFIEERRRRAGAWEEGFEAFEREVHRRFAEAEPLFARLGRADAALRRIPPRDLLPRERRACQCTSGIVSVRVAPIAEDGSDIAAERRRRQTVLLGLRGGLAVAARQPPPPEQ
jgi:hypothetical protein